MSMGWTLTQSGAGAMVSLPEMVDPREGGWPGRVAGFCDDSVEGRDENISSTAIGESIVPAFQRVPTVCPAQDIVGCNRFRFFGAQLPCPRHPVFYIGAGPGVLKFSVAGRLFAFLPAPIVPPGGLDSLGHLRVHKNHRRMVPPRPAQEGLGF